MQKGKAEGGKSLVASVDLEEERQWQRAAFLMSPPLLRYVTSPNALLWNNAQRRHEINNLDGGGGGGGDSRYHSYFSCALHFHRKNYPKKMDDKPFNKNRKILDSI